MKRKENQTRIGIIGYGVLGKALASVFEEKFNIFVYDKYQKEYENIENVSKNADIVFIGVPTPMKESGEIDLTHIKESLETLSEALKKEKREVIAVLRSTIIPGTTESLRKEYENIHLVFNPEFLTEKNFLDDMKNTSRVIIGSENKETGEVVKGVYLEVFPKANYILTDEKTAELIKYAANITLASQTIIANELYQICKALGIEYETVKNTILLDKRIGTHMNVPGHDGELGFGGKCFPKDLNALIKLSEQKGYDPELLKQVWKTNLKLRKKHDWEDIKGATSKNSFKSIH